MSNPYSPPATATDDKPARPEHDGVTKRFRFAVIPATLSFLLSGLLAVGIVPWIIQAKEVATMEHEYVGHYQVAIVMMMAGLLGGSAANFVAGRKWLRRRFFVALCLNLGSWLLLYTAARISHWVMFL